MTILRYNYPTRVHFGPGAIKMLPEVLAQAGVSRPLLLTDEGVAGLDIFKQVDALMREAGLSVSHFTGVTGNPVESQVTAGVDAYRAADADSIVVIGGGAALDVAKVVGLLIHHPGPLFAYEDGKPDVPPVDKHIPFLVAIPTTAGTGSEVGRSSVISDDVTKAKKIIFDPRLMPPVVLADPELTVGLPPHLTAATGLDALCHNVEAYLAKGFHPMADGIALEGVRLVARSLARAVANGNDVEARGDMLIASLMGAVAFQKGLGVTHSLAHPLSTVCDLHHGLANGIMMPHAMAFNAEVVSDRLASLAAAAGLENATAEGFVAWLSQLLVDLGLPTTLGAVGVTEAHLDALVGYAVDDVCYGSNPRDVTEADFRALFTAAL